MSNNEISSTLFRLVNIRNPKLSKPSSVLLQIYSAVEANDKRTFLQHGYLDALLIIEIDGTSGPFKLIFFQLSIHIPEHSVSKALPHTLHLLRGNAGLTQISLFL